MKKINAEGLDIEQPNRIIFRPSELVLTNKVYLTEEAYRILRRQKKLQKKSMAKIICDLIIYLFGKDMKKNS
ncbi:MAG: hypothetical protein WCX88_04265 [Patescibacteria group bacterium]|jgi:hypothetical protein